MGARNANFPKIQPVAQLCLTLFHPINSTVYGILQARILERVAFPFSRGSSQPRDWTQVSCIAGVFFTNWATREAQYHKDRMIKVRLLTYLLHFTGVETFREVKGLVRHLQLNRGQNGTGIRSDSMPRALIHQADDFLLTADWCMCVLSPSVMSNSCRPQDCQAPLFMGFPREVLEWVAISFSKGSSQLRVQIWVSCIGRQILYHWATWETLADSWTSNK